MKTLMRCRRERSLKLATNESHCEINGKNKHNSAIDASKNLHEDVQIHS